MLDAVKQDGRAFQYASVEMQSDREVDQSRRRCMNSQRAAGQGEAKAQPNPQPQAPLWRLGAPIGLECAFASPRPAARCESMALGPGVGFAFGFDFGDLPG